MNRSSCSRRVSRSLDTNDSHTVSSPRRVLSAPTSTGKVIWVCVIAATMGTLHAKTQS